MAGDRDEDGEGRSSIDPKRLVRRTWLILSACWVVFAFIRMLSEPALSRMILDRPLRILGAATAMMLGPPVMVYGAGLAVWLAGRRIRRRIGREP